MLSERRRYACWNIDKQQNDHVCRLKAKGIPTLVAVGPNGKTISNKAKDLLLAFGSDAYPFDEESVSRALERWPKRLSHGLHREHELILSTRDDYVCNGCEEDGSGWSFRCEGCDFDLDPKCALKKEVGGGEHEKESKGNGSDGLICNGQVCYRV